MEEIDAIPQLEARPAKGHKGDFGKVLVVAGSVGMSGAAALAGRAALRSGAGLVRVATPKSALPIVAAIDPCYTSIPLAQDTAGRISGKALPTILNALDENDAVAFGPGVGISAGLKSIAQALIEQQRVRVIIDGDGLNNLGKLTGWPAMRKAEVILTPHPGEMQRLWSGLFRESLPDDRIEQAARLAEHTGTTVVLKGAGTVVCDAAKVYVNKTGNPGMATAGSGDVLTGVILALLGQGLSSFDAAVLGVHVHGLAGDIAAEERGHVSLIATDILDALSDAFAGCS